MSAQVQAVSTGSSHLECAQLKSDLAQLTASRQQKKELSDAGIACAEQCLQAEPKNAPCLYYRAVNRGLLLETTLANPKDHLPLMIADFKKAAALDSRYDNAGALRALGYVYLKLPVMSLWGEGYSRDLNQAKAYAEKALKISSSEPDNLQLAGEVAFSQKKYQAALELFEKSLRLLQGSRVTSLDQKQQVHALERWIQKTRAKIK